MVLLVVIGFFKITLKQKIVATKPYFLLIFFVFLKEKKRIYFPLFLLEGVSCPGTYREKLMKNDVCMWLYFIIQRQERYARSLQ